MTRSLALMLSMVLLFSLMTVPTLVQVTAEPTPTTTLPLTTTSTTWVLTGPDGINPDYTSTAPWTTTTTEWGCISTPPPMTTTTTEIGCISTPAPTVTTTAPPVPADGEINLLAWATVRADDAVSVLSYPSDNFDLCADCYTNSGAALDVLPLEDGPWDASTARYLHMTVRTNMPFSVMLNGTYASKAWFAATAGTDDILPAGGYRMVIDLYDCLNVESSAYPVVWDIRSICFALQAAGSISVGHIALSNSAVCDEPIPNIQTTTKPSFPWDTTTGYTTTTTSTWGFTTTTTVILTGPDGTQSTTLPTTTTGTEEETTWPTTTTSTVPVYTSGKPVSSTRPTEFVTTIAPDGLIKGDMNCDFTLDMTDAFALYKAVSTGDFSEIAVLRLADLNGDGVYDMTDAFALYRSVSGD